MTDVGARKCLLRYILEQGQSPAMRDEQARQRVIDVVSSINLAMLALHHISGDRSLFVRTKIAESGELLYSFDSAKSVADEIIAERIGAIREQAQEEFPHD